MMLFAIKNKTTGKFVGKSFRRREAYKLNTSNTFSSLVAVSNSLKVGDLSPRKYEIVRFEITNQVVSGRSEELLNKYYKRKLSE